MKLLFAVIVLSLASLQAQPVGGALDWSRQIKNKPFVDVREFGAKGDGVADDTPAFTSAAATSRPIFVPAGNYLVSELDLPSEATIFGEGSGSVLAPVTAGDPIIYIQGTYDGHRSRVTIQNLHFKVSAASSGYAIHAEYTDYLTISDNQATNLNLVRMQFPAYTSVTSNHVSQSARITNNLIRFTSAPTDGHCIWLPYTANSTIATNLCDKSYHGITFWGGDSNPTVNGALTNPRWARNLTFTGNVIRNTVSGIWGSMGENIVMTGNAVENISDVGLDMEGVTGGVIASNTAENCVYGCISTFFLCQGINVSGNVVSQTTTTYPMLRMFNSGLSTDNRDISITGNTFNCKAASGSCVIDNANGPYFLVNFVGNTLYNTRIDFSLATSHGTTRIAKNAMLFSQDAGAPAIKLSLYGQATGSVSNNEIRSLVTQTGEAILAADNDFNASKTYHIRDNTIVGFDDPITTSTSGTNDGIIATFMVTGNSSTTGTVQKQESGTQQHVQYVSRNFIGSYVDVIDNRPDAVMLNDSSFVNDVNFLSGFRSWNLRRTGANAWATRGDGVNNGASMLYGRKSGNLYVASIASSGGSDLVLTDSQVLAATVGTFDSRGFEAIGGGWNQPRIRIGDTNLWWDKTYNLLRWKVGSASAESDGASLNWRDVPSTETSACVSGDRAYNSQYMYVCVSTNLWKRITLSTWGRNTFVGDTEFVLDSVADERIWIVDDEDNVKAYITANGDIAVRNITNYDRPGSALLRMSNDGEFTVFAFSGATQFKVGSLGEITLGDGSMTVSRPLKLNVDRRVITGKIDIGSTDEVMATGISTNQALLWDGSKLAGVTGADVSAAAVVVDLFTTTGTVPGTMNTAGLSGDALTVANALNDLITALGSGGSIVRTVTPNIKNLSATKGILTGFVTP